MVIVTGNFLRAVSSRIVKIAVSGGLIIYIVTRFGLANIVQSLSTTNPLYLIYALVVFCVSGILGSIQWGILLRFHGIRLGFWWTVKRYFMGLFFNYVFPGFIGGDVVRIYQTSLAGGQTTGAISSTLADRVMGFVILILFSLGSFFLLQNGPAKGALPVAITMFFILIGLIAVIAYRPAGVFIKRTFGRWLPGILQDELSALYTEMHELTRSPLTLISIFFTSLIIQITRISVHFLCGRAVGINLNFIYFTLFVPLMETVASIPISVGGIGVRESMGITLFSSVGIMSSDVFAYSLLATFIGFFGSIPGGIVFAFSKTKKGS
jgi:glycosyltransferase 2 family protein